MLFFFLKISQVYVSSRKKNHKDETLETPVAAFGDSCSCLHFWSHFWSPWSVSFTLSWTNEKRHITKEERPTIWSPTIYVFISQRKNWVWSKVCIFFKIYLTYTTRWANFLSLQKVWMNFGCISMSFHRFFCGKRQKEKKNMKSEACIFFDEKNLIGSLDQNLLTNMIVVSINSW